MTRPVLTPDTQIAGLPRWLPAQAVPFALLARFDRPIGWWLLFWPCAWGVLLAGGLRSHWPLILAMLVGAVAMRGAGCVYNDIVDRDLDAKVARTRGRPLASGAVSVRAAWIWLLALCLVGLAVLLMLPPVAAVVALGSLAPVAAYPFMKRITWWPQAWLGLVFAWGALVGGATVAGTLNPATLLLYAGTVVWVVGYDTIYAVQDIEDDAMVGVRSSARALGSHVRSGVAVAYLLALLSWGAAIWATRPQLLALFALLPVGLHLAGQVRGLSSVDGAGALARFRSNHVAGLLAALGFAVVGATA